MRHVLRSIVLGLLSVLSGACERLPLTVLASPAGSPVVYVGPARPRGDEIATASLDGVGLRLRRADGATTRLWMDGEDGPTLVPCDRLDGAWGMWTDDVDGDGHVEVLIALRKRARFDDRVANRLHVYGIEQGRCVPAWRGTRLAGRFDALATDPAAPGTIVVSERLGPSRRRVARYRWNDFGYRVDEVLWQGTTEPPAALVADLVVAPS